MSPTEVAKRALRAGAVAGIVVIYLCLVGMIEKFTIRNMIDDEVTLSRVLLVLPFFFCGFVATRSRIQFGEKEEMSRGVGILVGLGAGALTGGLTIAAATVADSFDPTTVRDIFVSVTPGLISEVTFEQGLGVGALILIVGGAGVGALGAAIRFLPGRFRTPLWAGLGAVLALGLLQRIIPTALFELGLSTDWLYSRILSGLTVTGAVITFVVATGLTYLTMRERGEVRRRVQELSAVGQRGVSVAGVVALLALLAILPQLLGTVLTNILGQVAVFVLMGLGLNIVVGYAGLLDLGYVAFFAVGAYTTALLTGARLVTSLGEQVPPKFGADLDFYAALPFVILAAALVGLLIGAPVLRLRGDYLAIVTLGFGEIVRVLVTSDALKEWVGGAQGMRDITDASLGGISFRDPKNFYYLALVLVLIAIFVSARLDQSRVGRAWNAMREDEQVAEVMGISVIKYKLLAFAMGGAVGCLSGAVFSVLIGSLNPRSFTLLISITVLAVVVLGGMGSIPGVVVGAMALIGVPLLLSEFEEFRLLIYGAVLIGIMILRPQGVIPSSRRARELEEPTVGADVPIAGVGV